jgi:glycosyltransferase involved in cell wall biosynthesis
LAGEADGSNPAAISSAQVKQWVDEGVVEWWGHCSDMAKVFGKSAIVCLPSYREGMPRALLEAAACARPVVTTDVIGCREAIIDGQTGILVPVCDSDALAQALLRLMDDPALRERMGNAGRERAIREFDIESVVQKHMSIYAAT